MSRNKIGHEKSVFFLLLLLQCRVTIFQSYRTENQRHTHLVPFSKWSNGFLFRQASFVLSVGHHSLSLSLTQTLRRSAAAAKSMRIQSTGNETLMRQKIHKKRFILHFFSFVRSFVAKRKHWLWRVFRTSVSSFFFCSSVTRRSWVKLQRSFFADVWVWAFRYVVHRSSIVYSSVLS